MLHTRRTDRTGLTLGCTRGSKFKVRTSDAFHSVRNRSWRCSITIEKVSHIESLRWILSSGYYPAFRAYVQASHSSRRGKAHFEFIIAGKCQFQGSGWTVKVRWPFVFLPTSPVNISMKNFSEWLYTGTFHVWSTGQSGSIRLAFN